MQDRQQRSGSARPSRHRIPPAVFSQSATVRDVSAGQPASRKIKRHIPGYELLEEIGQGGMGVVYKARQIQLGRLVALKMLRPGSAGMEDRNRFRREAEAVAQLEHPGIVRIHDIGEQDDQPFLSLEFAPQGSLDRHLAGKPLPAVEAARLVGLLADAVHFAHQAGIIHRDLKPGNILLFGSPPQPKITDFGLAKQLGQVGHTQPGQILGTPAYMAPEQAEGRSDVGPATDLYALGAIFYECLTGRPPFVANSLAETLEQVRQHDPPPIRQLNPQVPLDAETIALKCLEKQPSRRYASAADLSADLRRFLAGQPIVARRVGWFERFWKWSRRYPSTAALVGVCFLFLIALMTAIPLHILRLQARVEAVTAQLTDSHQQQRRLEAQRQLSEGQSKLRRKGLDEVEGALLLFAAVQQSISDEEANSDAQLAALRHQAGQLRQRAGRTLDELRGLDAIRGRVRQFRLARDRAIFQLSPEFFVDSRVQPSIDVLQQCQRALDRLPDTDSLPAAEKLILEQERQALLLLMAEITSRSSPSPDRIEHALALLEEAALLGRSHAVRVLSARFLALLGDHQASECEQYQARVTPPRTALDWFIRGQQRWRAGKLSRALADFERALTLQPDLLWCRLLRALGLMQQGDLERARIELDLCVAAQPRFVWSYLLRAQVQVRNQAYSAAQADLEQAGTLDLDQRSRYAWLLQRGALALAQGQAAVAIGDFQAAVLLEPSRPDAHAHLAHAYWQGGQLDRALLLLNHSLSLDAKQAALYRMRSQLYSQREQYPAALADIDRAIELAPGETQLAYRCDKAYLLYLARRPAQALRELEPLLVEQPDQPALLRLHAEVLLELGRAQLAVEAFDRYLRHGKPDVNLYRRRARARAELGDLSGVVEDYTLALALHREPSLLSARGWAHLLQGDARPALRDFQAALSLAPNDPEALLGMGNARIELGETEAGLLAVESALQTGLATGRLNYRAARALVQASTRLPRRSLELQRRALALLRRTVENDAQQGSASSWIRQLVDDPVWHPLRGQAEWRQLLRQLGQ